MVCTIYAVSTFGVYCARFYFPSSVELEVSTFGGPQTTYSVFTFCDPYYLLRSVVSQDYDHSLWFLIAYIYIYSII